MISLHTAIILISIHLIYYSILQVFSDLLRIGSVKNTPNPIITKLRSQFKVKLLTFQKNTPHWGFAWFKTIHLNESLFRNEKALRFTFHHELYHVQHKHKLKTLLNRLAFSLTPILLVCAPWYIFFVIYFLYAYFLFEINKHYEKEANQYAEEMIKNV
ncbi:MAG: hypothetical protein PHT07_23820 [Paludibacter sp.]|nr:hypothetical protein [Paludibacter sp.]